MNKEIKIEKAKNQKEEKIPVFETYYLGFTRYYNSAWIVCGMTSTDKKEVIDNIRMYWSTADENKIISIELPF